MIHIARSALRFEPFPKRRVIRNCSRRFRMPDRRVAISASVGCLLFITAVLFTVPSYRAADTLPHEIPDDTYWKMVSDYSEDSGSFRFEYMSNELQFQYVI